MMGSVDGGAPRRWVVLWTPLAGHAVVVAAVVDGGGSVMLCCLAMVEERR